MATKSSLKAVRAPLALTAMIAVTTATTGCIEDPDCGICDPDNLILQNITGINYGLRKVHLLSPTCVGDDCPAEFDEGEYFIEKIGPCEEEDEALEADRGPVEYCKLAPIAGTFGIEFIFNNLLEAQSLEQVRKRPDNPQLFEVYDWKTQVVEIQGPITRFNGDFYKGEGEGADIITRSVNLSCIDNLRDAGQDFGHEDYQYDPVENPDGWRDNPCNKVSTATKLPLKLRAEEDDGSKPVTKSYRGELDWRSGSCDTPDDRADDCCSVCDFELSVNVAKYGLNQEYNGEGRPDQALFRTPNNPGDPEDPRGAFMCDPVSGDKYIDCESFVPWINRSTEVRTYDYAWDTPGTRETFPLPVYDKLRETHPDQRPDGLERKNVRCTQDADCYGATAANLPGSACVGELASGVPGLEDLAGKACDPTRHDPGECVNAHCVAQWFVTCRADADTTGAQGYCRDARYYDRGAPACLRVTHDFTATDPEQGDVDIRKGKKIAECDRDLSGLLTARECCKEGLGSAPSSEQSCTMALPCNDTEDSACECPDGETCCPPFEVCLAEQCWAACDPLMQQQTEVVPIFERNVNLPDVTRGCMCEEDPPEECKTLVDNMCREDSDPEKPIKEEREGQYAMKMVTKVGGVVYDPSIKGFDWRPGHIGQVERALIEQCAEQRNLIGGRNIEDGWRSNDVYTPHYFEDFDRALCSGSSYDVVFNTPSDHQAALEENPEGKGVEYVRDKVDNTLEGKNVYQFETADFHVATGSGFPTDNLRIGACDDFSLKFSAKYDVSEENLKKIQIWSVDDDGTEIEKVAGGLDCSEDPDVVFAEGLDPCLTVDVANQYLGEVKVEIDPVVFGAVLETDHKYRIVVPGLDSKSQMSDEQAYQDAFWDVCGMPLVAGDIAEGKDRYYYDFTIDAPKCKEDKDRDGVQLSCDNAPDHYNPDQSNFDNDDYGDVMDLCATVPSGNNTGDSDNDGVGNDCDNCRQTRNQYNTYAEDLALPAYMYIRNIPFQTDTDQDGIGDVCDNCVLDANCEDYGPGNPYSPGDPIAYDDPNVCQRDDNHVMIGYNTTCAATTDDDATWITPEAVGKVGFGPDDDFDQDGLRNSVDGCPRQPVAYQTCESDAECGTCDEGDQACLDALSCENGVCNHHDADADGVGDVCDTCPFKANPMQVAEGGAQEDDEDGDFIGNLCEASSECNDTKNPRPYSFYEVAASGNCCVVLYEGGTVPCEVPLEGQPNPCPQGYMCDDGDPDADGPVCNLESPGPEADTTKRIPVRATCSDDDVAGEICRKLPISLWDRPGMMALPPGCDLALADAGIEDEDDNRLLTPDDFDGDVDALWEKMCFMPSWDQDFDGVGDKCDLCPFDFDPDNLQHIDENNKLWPNFGKYCNGPWDIENTCVAEEGGAGTATGTATATGTGSGTGGGSGSGY